MPPVSTTNSSRRSLLHETNPFPSFESRKSTKSLKSLKSTKSTKSSGTSSTGSENKAATETNRDEQTTVKQTQPTNLKRVRLLRSLDSKSSLEQSRSIELDGTSDDKRAVKANESSTQGVFRVESSPSTGRKGFLTQLSELSGTITKGLARLTSDDLSTSSADSPSTYVLKVQEETKEIQNQSIGVLVHSQGAPLSRHDRLVLHVGTLTLEGFHREAIRRRDLKVLKKLCKPARDIIVEVFQKVTIFDYELQHRQENMDKTVTKLDNISSLGEKKRGFRWGSESRRKLQKKVKAFSNVKKLLPGQGNSRKASLICDTNSQLKAFGLEAFLVKREERLIGTTASVYYLLVRCIDKAKGLPFT